MSGSAVDVLVIGGGITGAGIARDAAMRGMRVALLERRDFASGTSSRSSKLIHGGVRYLAQGDVALVLEAAEERRTLRRIAPHLTQPRPMLLPTYGRGAHAKLNLGLWTYEKLASIPEAERHTMLDGAGALECEPLLRPEGLVGAARYPENVTDDARLVLATLASAKSCGAMLASYAEVRSLSAGPGGMRVRVRDHEDHGDVEVAARIVVNAAGPWSDFVRGLEGPSDRAPLHLTCGIHFVVRRDDLPVRNMVVLRAPDKRQAFAIPHGEVVYVGTTDTDHPRAEDYPGILRRDVEYLIAAVRASFPTASWGVERVVSAWAGIRPLIHQEGKAPSEISRRDEITVGPLGMISVAGGKLTTYRRMAERVVDLAARQLGVERPCSTADEPLEGGDFPASPQVLAQELTTRFAAHFPGLSRSIDRLVLHYGSQAADMLERSLSQGGETLPGGSFLAAEVDRAIESEGALHVCDVIERRLRATLFDADRGLTLAPAVTDRMADAFGWDRERRDRELDAYRKVAATCLPV